MWNFLWQYPIVLKNYWFYLFFQETRVFYVNIYFIHSMSYNSVQFSSVAQSCLTLCEPTNRSTPGLSVHYQLPEFTQSHVHRISDAIQLSHPLLSPSPPAPNPSQHQSLLQWVNSSHEVTRWRPQPKSLPESLLCARWVASVVSGSRRPYGL